MTGPIAGVMAIVPAAGESSRMGRPKLVLPVGHRSLIAGVIAALAQGGAERVFVVTPPDAATESAPLRSEIEAAGGEVVSTEIRPADMRASIEHGIEAIARLESQPATLLIVPGDSPGLTADLVRKVVTAAKQAPDAPVVPVVGGRRGHPLALPWALARTIRDLPPDLGVNALVRQHADRLVAIPTDDPGALADLDTPEDLAAWQARPQAPDTADLIRP